MPVRLHRFLVALMLLGGLSLAPALVSGATNLLDQAGEWRRVSWKKHGEAGPDAAVMREGREALRVSDDKLNDIRLTKRVRVRAGRFYRFSAWVRTQAVAGEVGANLCVDGTFNRSRVDLTGTGDWTRVEQVFRATRTEVVRFALRLGYWNATASGTAWFDEVELEALEHWHGPYEPIIRAASTQGGSSVPLRWFAFLFVVPFVYGGLAWLRRDGLSGKPAGPPAASPLVLTGLSLLLVAGLAARLLFLSGPVSWADPPDLVAWALYLSTPINLWSAPLSGVETPAPLWLYWLTLAGGLVKAQMLEGSRLLGPLIGLPAVVGEMVVIGVILDVLRRREGTGAFWVSAWFLIFNPALLAGTALAAVPAGLGAAFVLLAFFALTRKRLITGGIFLGLGIAAEPLVLWLIPLFLARAWALFGAGAAARLALAAAGTAALVAVPVIRIYGADAAALLGGFPVPWNPGQGLSWGPALVLYLVAVAMLVSRLIAEKATAREDGTFAFALLALSLTLTVITGGLALIWLYLAVVIAALCRPVGPFWRWLYFLLSVAAAWYWGYGYFQGLIIGSAVPETGLVFRLLGVAFVLLATAVWWAILVPQHAAGSWHSWRGRRHSWTKYWFVDPVSPGQPFPVGARDIGLLVGIWFGAFLLVAHDMGEVRYPVNGYRMGATTEVFIVDFAAPVSLGEVRVYTGANGLGDFRFEAMKEGEWGPLWKAREGLLRYKGSQRPRRSTFKLLWKRVETAGPVSRIRVTLTGRAVDVTEIAFLDENLSPLSPATISLDGEVAGMSAHEHPLFDELHRVTPEKGYRAKTYWDEVYYARSAWDLAHGTAPYERSHPPLGKTMITQGVRMLDMTPFGWRFMNALFVSLLPVLLWLGARSLFGTRLAAYCAAFLAVFELMFFVHGRWANIDTFLVFFLTSSLLLLYHWYRLDDGRFTPRNLPWFVAAGALFGAAVSTKWSALFTGFAVFVLWLVSRGVQLARISARPDSVRRQSLLLYLGKDLPLNLLAWGCVFVLLPLAIYYLSYAMLPAEHDAFSAEGWRAFWEQQRYQWSFHADKEGGHGSNALVFTWPFLLQPASMFRSGGLPPGVTATLNILGNPVIWWTGFVAMLAVGWRALSGRDNTAVFLAGIYFLQGLPWLLVTRTTFIYHYLPFLPLLILGLCYWVARLDLRRRPVRIALGAFGVLVIAGFILYYPYVTALPVPVNYTDAVRIFEGWSRL